MRAAMLWMAISLNNAPATPSSAAPAKQIRQTKTPFITAVTSLATGFIHSLLSFGSCSASRFRSWAYIFLTNACARGSRTFMG